jgi:phytoene dehydrogenase-like protein
LVGGGGAARPAAPVPASIDVAIVGAGITGLNAALVLARAGRSVAVFDAGDLGQGAGIVKLTRFEASGFTI